MNCIITDNPHFQAEEADLSNLDTYGNLFGYGIYVENQQGHNDETGKYEICEKTYISVNGTSVLIATEIIHNPSEDSETITVTCTRKKEQEKRLLKAGISAPVVRQMMQQK